MTEVLLRIEDLAVNFYTYEGVVKALDGITLDLRRGETLGVVGETGCGKSVTVQSILKLIPIPPGKIEGGRALLLTEETCPQCEGTGCSNCDRTGEVSQCDSCEGTGRCAECRGLGQARDTESVCVYCRGSGRCFSCFGSGKKYVNLLRLKEEGLRRVRGNRISMIFQEPMSALNPVYRVGEQIAESFFLHQRIPLCGSVLSTIDQKIASLTENGGTLSVRALIFKLHRRLYRRMLKRPDSKYLKFLAKLPLIRRYERWLKDEAYKKAIEMLDRVKVPTPEEIARRYPFELSGGMQQRVLIAIALACRPEVLIADEPTTALDVTIQAQILKLMQGLKSELKSSIIFITHDLAVIAQVCDRVSVMYAGTICETGNVVDIFKNPFHPYTQGLMKAVPRPDEDLPRLEEIAGTVPNLIHAPSGCRFHPRCPHAKEYCEDVKPAIIEKGGGHSVACHIYGPEGDLWGSRVE
ncbi:MAG: oligopeptide/dipeptide ABC transporter ATP-binding protein [Thermoplasmata archaeon]